MQYGVYNSLEDVVDLYYRGGGAGIGIDAEYQTLPPEPLELTEQEQQELIDFMKTLTDFPKSDNIEKEIGQSAI